MSNAAHIHLPVLQEAPAPETVTREMLRSRRKRDVRAVTISTKRMTKRELKFGKMIADATLESLGDVERPHTRGECTEERPCPFVSCAHHLYLDVSDRTGAIKMNFPDIDAEQLEKMPATCALDVADRDGATLEEVGEIMNLTRESVRQVEMRALAKTKRAIARGALGDYARDYPDTGRISDADVARLKEDERTRPMPNHGYSDKVWSVLSDGRRISVDHIAKDADLSYKVARQTIDNFHRAGKVNIFDNADGGIDAQLIEGAERIARRKPATEQKKTAPVSVPPPRALVHVPKVKDLTLAPPASGMRFTLRYFEAKVDCASAQDVAELLGALKQVMGS
ncbi:MAG TPA: sigma factor-like helix-turn-helix DNA-binding protein [Polyangiaceae bacterium]|jgi:hypothetical protein